MKAKTKHSIRSILLWAAICCLLPAGAQTLTVTDSTYNSCNSNGVVKVFASGGTAPYTYTLVGIYGTTFGPLTQSGSVFTGLSAGYYNVIVSDVNGINNIAQPAYAYIYSSVYAYVNITPAICPATTGSEQVYAYQNNGATGGTYTYLWSNGSTTDSATNVPLGTHYTCTVTDNNGCTVLASDSGRMYQSSNITSTFVTTPANCTNGTATVTAANGTAPYSYIWSTTQTGATATGLSPGYPTVTITDAQGCSAIGYASITQAITISTLMNATAATCTQTNGTLTISPQNGTTPFTYLWSSGQTTPHITDLAAGYYFITVTDHNGCTAENYGQVQTSTPIVLTTSTTRTVCTSPTGSATVIATGGTAPYSYSWSTVPAQSTSTATGLPAGYYVVNVVDAVGCVQNQSAQVSNNTTLYASITETDAHCGGTPGSVAVYASGGSTPYSYQWNTGATTSSLNSVPAGGYICLVTDHLGCTVEPYADVNLISPVYIQVAATDASCIYTADGSATVSVSGGTAPYSYYWSNGQTNVTTSTGYLPDDYYGVDVTDVNGCWAGASFNIGYASIQPCAVNIAGTVYKDFNSDCLVDGPDGPLQGVWIGCTPNGGYQWTTNGNFNFTLPPGTYTLYEAPPVYYSLVCPLTPPTVTLTAGQSSLNNNFLFKPDTLVDLTINCIPYTHPVAGFTQHLRILIDNLGNITESPTVVYQHALDITFLSSSPAPATYDALTGKITWSGPSVASTGINAIDLYFNIPSTLPLGHILNNSDTVNPWINDVDTFNNYEYVQDNVVGSYDPNYIDVTPKGIGAPGYITTTTDTTLRYVVHFQNTGTHAATYVKLKIPVDANLDMSTFRFIGASHSVSSIAADDNRMLTITFNNINLPDSSASQLGSQGFAAFTFRQKRGLAPSNTIRESANIYFDYNPPVPTDTTLNTIPYPAGISVIAPNSSFSLYPNPTQDNVTLDLSALNESRVEVRVYDMTGRVALAIPYTTISGTKQLSLSTSGLAAGVYTVEVTGNASYVRKLVKTDK